MVSKFINTSGKNSTFQTYSKLGFERFVTYNWHKFWLEDPFLVIQNLWKRGELLFSHMVPKSPPKLTSPNKPPKSSTMNQEERDENFHQIEKDGK